MDLPKIRKQLWDRLPKLRTIGALTKGAGLGVLALTVGALASPAQSAVPPATEEYTIPTPRTERPKLILKQRTTHPSLHAQHGSHESHYSHSSHESHYSHYSSG